MKRTHPIIWGIVILLVYILFVFVYAARSWAHGQTIDRTPTLEQCRADVRAWVEQAHFAYNDSEQISPKLRSLTVPQLLNRKSYLNDCWSIDREDAEGILGLGDLYGAEIIGRYRSFLKRRGLLKDFLLEDAARMR